MTQRGGADGPGEGSQAHLTEPSDTEHAQTEHAQAEPGDAELVGTGPAGTERQDDGARGETYLRLLAERELRVALACPRSPVERIPPAAVLWAANAVGAVSGTADLAARSLRPAAERAGQAAGPWAASARRLLAPSARQAQRALPPRVRRAGQAVAPQARQAAAALAPRVRRAGRAVAQAGWQARIAADRVGTG